MFKLVALCALFAAAAAEPGVFTAPLAYSSIGAPLTYTGAYAAPANTYISPAAGFVQPALYSTPYGYSHFIKKRSAPFAYSSYIAPTTYLASSPLATSYSSYSTPVVSSAAVYPVNTPITYATAAHFIKKRSAPIVAPATYITPTTYAATSPYLSTAYSTPLYTTHYAAPAPLAYPAHFIKKRSAPLVYSAPAAAVSHQSRVDYTGPVVSSYAAVSPFGYTAASPISYAGSPISYAAPISYASSFATA